MIHIPHLYKYIKINASYPTIENFLTLKFSSPETLNDPFEFLLGKIEEIKQDEKNKIFDFLQKNHIVLPIMPQDSVDKVNKYFKENIHKIKKDHYKLFNDRVKITSFSEENNNILMWSHYTNNHEGIVIEYNLSKMIERLKTENVGISYSKVIYSTDMPCIRNLCVLDNTEQLKELKKIISTKSNCWNYEKEWRLFLTNLDYKNDDQVNYVKIIPEEITKIYFGVRCSEENIDKISSFVNTLKINCSIFKTSIDNEHYKLNFYKIN